MRRFAVIIIILFLIASSAGCSYMKARLRDAADCVSADFTVGWGAGARVNCTWLAGAGFVYIEDCNRHGLHMGQFFSKKKPAFAVGGIAPVLFLHVPGQLTTVLGIPHYASPEGVRSANPLEPSFDLKLKRSNIDDFLDLAVGLHIIYYGFEFRVKLMEIADFLIGLTTIDILGDDNRR